VRNTPPEKEGSRTIWWVHGACGEKRNALIGAREKVSMHKILVARFGENVHYITTLLTKSEVNYLPTGAT